MAQIRASWFSCVRSALVRLGLDEAITPQLAQTTKQILMTRVGDVVRAPSTTDAPPPSSTPAMWFDEGHAVAVYEAVVAARALETCREVGRDAARFAMQTMWRELMTALAGHLGGTPRMAFAQLPVLWNATRREAGEVVLVESSSRHAVTEVRDFPYAKSPAWQQVWLGHHDALLRHLRFGGGATLGEVDPVGGRVRVRVAWNAALGGAPTGGFGQTT